jgi:hypothetical protein
MEPYSCPYCGIDLKKELLQYYMEIATRIEGFKLNCTNCEQPIQAFVRFVFDLRKTDLPDQPVC